METPVGRKTTFRIWVEPKEDSGYQPFYISIVNYNPDKLREVYKAIGVNSNRTRLFSREKIEE